MDAAPLCWPLDRLGEALSATARAAGLALEAGPTSPPASPDRLDRWVEAAAGSLGVEAQPVHARYGELDGLIRAGSPALLRLQGEGTPRWLAVIGRGRWGRVRLLTPAGEIRTLPPAAIGRMLCAEPVARLRPGLERLVDEAQVPAARRERALAAFLDQRLGGSPIDGSWLLRPRVAPAFWRRARRGPGRSLALLVATSGVEYALLLLAWWLVGRGALQGQLEPGWLLAWLLLLVTLVPLRMLGGWLQGSCAVEAGLLLKQRLLDGVLRLHPDEIRQQGAGQLMSRVLEAEVVEYLGVAGGLGLAVAAVELCFAGWVLAQGAGGALHLLALLAWLAAVLAMVALHWGRRRRWTDRRLAMTHQLVEAMVGQRTRVVQLPPERWHQEEDLALEGFLTASRDMDRGATVLNAAPARGWMLLGIAALLPAVVAGAATPSGVAIALGGVFLAGQAMQRVAHGTLCLVDAGIGWRRVAALFAASARPELAGSPLAPLPPQDPALPAAPGWLLEARDLGFTYAGRQDPVLHHLDLRIAQGDRVLVEGVSGGGKSTLLALLAGLRQPDSGLLLHRGLDRPSLGAAAWCRAVASAPQFHENHVFEATFAFNLLLGRRWPPRPGDMEEAEALCAELGLGELLERMPSGMLQLVGESGWQLSHGERSRLYLARALLQGAPLVLLDESFAALDPENLDLALRCALARAPALLVVAHP
jgi:ATP-binding cassette subfamily B protein